MKQILPILVVAVMLFTGCEQNVPLEQTTAEYIKGHTFVYNRNVGVLEFDFNKDNSVVYRWRNTWEKETHSRSDLYYQVINGTTFRIYRDSDNAVWSNGTYYAASIPFILLDSHKGDTLILKR